MTRELTDFLEELKQRPEVLGVILFGSWARGNQRPDSDIDLVVILTEGYRRTVEYRNQQAFEMIYITEKEAFELWTPAPKQRLGKIKETTPEMYSLLERFYQESTPMKEKLSIARKMIPLVFEP